MRSMPTSVPRLVRLAGTLSGLAVLALVVSGCASGEEGPNFAATVFFSPSQPLVGKSSAVRVVVTSAAGGAAVSGATIGLSATGEGGSVAPVTLTETEEAGTYTARKLVFAAAGAYSVSLDIAKGAARETHTLATTAGCGSNGQEGAPCCEESVCSAGLSCVFGTCSAQLAADGAGCHEGNDCSSGVCTDELCAVAACDDGVHNGTEADLDCGGPCSTKCGGGKLCKVDADCLHGKCLAGLCDLGPGELIGTGDPVKPTAKLKALVTSDMADPTDLAFSSLNPDELWIVNRANDTITVVFNAGKADQQLALIRDFSHHFLEWAMAIDFSDNSTFGTCGDSRNDYNGQAKANNFMGPVLWPAAFSDYKPVSSAHQVHGDMLHSSPYCMGIAAESGNSYYVFNGYHGTIDHYDFGIPHVPGGTDHSDGIKRRYQGLKVKRVQGVGSHMQYDQQTGKLYVADTGNARVLRIDDSKSNKTNLLPSFGGDGKLYSYTQPQIDVLAAPPGGLQQPSGLAYEQGVLYIGDAATGKLHAYDVSAAAKASAGTFGKHLRSFDTGLAGGALGGIVVGPDRRLYLLDRTAGRLLRVEP